MSEKYQKFNGFTQATEEITRRIERANSLVSVTQWLLDYESEIGSDLPASSMATTLAISLEEMKQAQEVFKGVSKEIYTELHRGWVEDEYQRLLRDGECDFPVDTLIEQAEKHGIPVAREAIEKKQRENVLRFIKRENEHNKQIERDLKTKKKAKSMEA